jgi:hypothetical protein
VHPRRCRAFPRSSVHHWFADIGHLLPATRAEKPGAAELAEGAGFNFFAAISQLPARGFACRVAKFEQGGSPGAPAHDERPHGHRSGCATGGSFDRYRALSRHCSGDS